MVILFIFAHNPLSGYRTFNTITVQKSLPPCDDENKRIFRDALIGIYKTSKDQRELAEMTGGVERSINVRVGNCHLYSANNPVDGPYVNELQDIPLPLGLWKSNEPLVEWFGYVLNLVYSVLATIVIGAVFTFVVFGRTPNQGDRS